MPSSTGTLALLVQVFVQDGLTERPAQDNFYFLTGSFCKKNSTLVCKAITFREATINAPSEIPFPTCFLSDRLPPRARKALSSQHLCTTTTKKKRRVTTSLFVFRNLCGGVWRESGGPEQTRLSPVSWSTGTTWRRTRFLCWKTNQKAQSLRFLHQESESAPIFRPQVPPKALQPRFCQILSRST
jgi:hypothetical protein